VTLATLLLKGEGAVGEVVYKFLSSDDALEVLWKSFWPSVLLC
jgi:hypothetical protein